MLIIILVLITAIIGISIFLGSHSYKFPKEPNKYTPEKYGFEFEEISIPTKNKKKLYGWWIPAENPHSKKLPIIVLIHGWSRNVDRMMSYIKQLHPKGYNLLAFDSRCHGKSDNDQFSSIVKFMEDIRASIDNVEIKPNVDNSRIGLLGLSIGGSASIYAAALDARVKSVVTVGAFSHPKKVMSLEFKKHKIPYYPFVWIIFKYMEFRIGAKFNDIAPMNNISNSNAKFLLVHGTLDQTVPIEQGIELAKAGNPDNVKFLQIDNKGHSDCNHSLDFWPTVFDFYKNTI